MYSGIWILIFFDGYIGSKAPSGPFMFGWCALVDVGLRLITRLRWVSVIHLMST